MWKINTYDYDWEYITFTTDWVYAWTFFYRNWKFSITNICWLIEINEEFKDKLNLKYLYYFLKLNWKKYSNWSWTWRYKLYKWTAEKIDISFPDLNTQLKIVNFLDIIESLDINLNNELISRSKQFKFYLDLLLWTIEWEEISLWKISNMKTWISFNKKKDEIEEWNKYDENEIYKLLNSWNITLNNTLKLDKVIKLKKTFKKIEDKDFLKKWEILICTNNWSKEHIWKSVYFEQDTQYLTWWFMWRIKCISDKILPKFLFYILVSWKFKKYIEKHSETATIWKISKWTFDNFKFKLPNLETQQQIVNLLDTFNEYINWLTNNKTWLSNLINLNNKLLKFYLETLIK